MLKSIVIVTLLVARPGLLESAYQEHLGYQTVRRGEITPELAEAWGAPRLSGRDYVLMGPESGAEVWLRFVAMPPGVEAPTAMQTHGWNATEILVEDPDGLAVRLEGSPFRVIGQPADLMESKDAPRAMQVLGPAGELLYFTRIIPGGSGFDLGAATTPVDRVFITVVGGPSLDGLRAFYGDVLGMPTGEVFRWPIAVLAEAHGLPADTIFSLAPVILPKDFLIEIDEYPPTARPRPQPEGSLPGGMAMVSFAVDRLEAPGAGRIEWRHPPRAIADFPYRGRRVAVTVGPAGEWIEMIETIVPPPQQP